MPAPPRYNESSSHIRTDGNAAWHGGGQEKRANGTAVHTTAIFGFALAGLVVQDVERRSP